jgi:hypothetical protein
MLDFTLAETLGLEARILTWAATVQSQPITSFQTYVFTDPGPCLEGTAESPCETLLHSCKCSLQIPLPDFPKGLKAIY